MVFRGKSKAEAVAGPKGQKQNTANALPHVATVMEAQIKAPKAPEAQDTMSVSHSNGLVVKAETEERGLAAIEGGEPGTLGLPSLADARAVVLPFAIAVFLLFFMAALWCKGGKGETGDRPVLPASSLRDQVEALPLLKAQELEMMMFHSPQPQQSDEKVQHHETLRQPLRPDTLLRLQGRIVDRGRGKGTLTAPLSQQECVLFSTSVSATCHDDDGTHLPILASQSCSVNFAIALLDAPHVHLPIRGEDVLLFDMQSSFHEELPFAKAPEEWQDFVLAHPMDGKMVASRAKLFAEGMVLGFHEVALRPGDVVTCVGEIRTGHDGSWALWPAAPASAALDKHSAEKSDQYLPEKVFVSNDSRILSSAGRRAVLEPTGAVPLPKPLLPSGATAVTNTLSAPQQATAASPKAGPREFDDAMLRLKDAMRGALREVRTSEDQSRAQEERGASKENPAQEEAARHEPQVPNLLPADDFYSDEKKEIV